MGRRDDRACGSSLFENPVHFGAARYELAEAELAELRCAGGYCRVLREFGTRVEGEDEPALELEDDDCACRCAQKIREFMPDPAVGN